MSLPPPRRPLNPDEVISESDIPGWYVNGGFIFEGTEEAAKLTSAQKASGRGILRAVTFADGRIENYLRNEDQPPTWEENGRSGRYGSVISTGVKKELRDDWDKRVEAANARAEKEAPTAQTPASQRTAREEAEIARNAALPPEQDPYPETDADRKARGERVIKEQGAAARQGQIDADTRAQNAATATRQAQQDARQAQIDAQNLATAKAAADAKNEPQVIYREIKNPDGSTRNVQVRVHPGGREEIVASAIPGQPAPREAINVHRNPETGEWEEVYRDPTTGRAAVRVVPPPNGTAPTKSPAPLLPQIVVSQSQDALRTAYAQIQEEVDSGRRTAAWGENRRKEVFEAAQLAVNESHLIEQSRQANQTTAFNVANAQMGYGQSSLTNALKFTLDINDKLKPGSGTGGKMFAALFNMQMAMGVASGMYGMNVPRGSSVGAPGAPAAPGQPAAAPGGQPAPAPPRLSNVGDPAAVEADHQQSLAQLAAGDAADAAAAAAAPGGRAMTPSMGGPAQALPIRDGVPVTSTPALPGGAAVPPPDVGAADIRAPRGPLPRPAGFAALDALRQQYQPRPAAVPQLDPRGGIPPGESTGLPTFGPTAPYGHGGLDQQTGGVPPALMRAQIAATPPWRLDPNSLESLIQEHGEDVVFGWPGQNLLGVG